MSLVQHAFAAVAAIVVVVFVLLYWHESRRPETRLRPEAVDRSGAPARGGDPEGTGRQRPGP